MVRYGYQDYDDWEVRGSLLTLQLYVVSFYFTITTITTVGFGDISGGTISEQMICLVLMVIGVIAFSFATGTLSSILSNLDSTNAKLKGKLALLLDIKEEYRLPQALYDDLRSALKFDHQRNIDETISFVEELPHKLRIELAYRIHQKILSGIEFFTGKPKDFIAFVGRKLRPMRVKRGQYLYKSGDPLLEVYFLTKGEAAFVLPQCNDLAYLIVEEGDVFGIEDLVPEDKQSVIEKEATRTFSVMALEFSKVLSLSIEVNLSYISTLRTSRRYRCSSLLSSTTSSRLQLNDSPRRCECARTRQTTTAPTSD